MKKRKKQPKRLSPEGLMGFTRDQIRLGMVSNAGPAMIGFLPSFPGQGGVMKAMEPLRLVPQIHATGYMLGAVGEMGDFATGKKSKRKRKRKR
jgi:hypothetical protein